MLFNTLDTLKRKMVMMIIFFLFTGLTMFVIPVSYIPVLGKAFVNWLTGTLPILLGAISLYYALTYLRRSGRKGWWVFAVLSCLLLLFGTILFINPWAKDERVVLWVIGGTLFYSAVVYIICLFWIWPFQQKDNGGMNDDGAE